MFVHPGQVAQIVARHPDVQKARLVVAGAVGRDSMQLRIEVSNPSETLAEEVAQSVREITKLRADVDCVEPGALPNDGKVIDDVRNYE